MSDNITPCALPYVKALPRDELLSAYVREPWDKREIDDEQAAARQLNERPRETLQFYLPAEKPAECVAAID